MPAAASGFIRALSALSEAGVAYVVVGVGGINFYARTPADAFATLDLDALLDPEVGNLRTALHVLTQLGYAFESGDEPFVDIGDHEVLAGMVRNGAMLSARHREEGQIDLLLSITGSSFAQLADDARSFRVAGVDVRVGSLEKLLRAKQASGRPKDLEFLRAFEARAGAGDGDED